jgi:hypothetical protein
MVIHFLRRASLCLWVSLLISGFGSFWILTAFQPEVGADAAPWLAAGLLVAAFLVVGWTADRLGLGRVQQLIRRADRAEREGLRGEAERAFQSALGLLDSFLISARARRRTLLPLAGRMARHYLSETHFSPAAEEFIARYLWAHPQDEDVAEQWVRHAEQQGGLQEEHQDLADRLAGAHPRHAIIQRAAARLCLASERTDYGALQIYRRVCAEAGGIPPEFRTELPRLFGNDERLRDWHRSILPSGGSASPPPARAGTATVPALPRASERPEPSVGPEIPPAAEEEAAAVFCLTGEIDEIDEDEADARTSLLARPRRGAAWLNARVRQAVAAREFLRDRLQRWSAGGAGWVDGIRRDPRLRRALALCVILGIAAGGGWLALNTAGVFEPSSTDTADADAPSASVSAPPEPFALQVAAYLKQDYALKLVDDLKKKGLKAYWIETTNSGKTWYQVRIAGFPDPQSAREFGRSLKSKGLIDDFYVTGASR